MEKLRFNRREFLSALSLGTGYLMFTNPLSSCSDTAISTDPFQMVKLGNSGLKTTLLGMGTGVHGFKRSSNLTRRHIDESMAVLRHAYDVGIRMFDCADNYGTHPLMSEAFTYFPREEITLISKIWVREGSLPEDERPDANIVVERFLKEMNTDYIDLLQLHCLVDEKWDEVYGRQMDILANLKAQGKIRAHGVSVHSLEAMKTALASEWVDVIHVRINPYGIAMDKPEPEEVVNVIHDLHNAGKGIIGMKLIGGGKYSENHEKIDNAFKFVMRLKSVDTIIIGFDYIEQIGDYSARMKKVLTEMYEA
jgi:aryl-alcohol dehydrogenase-like predicted oxidoreductase